MNSEREYMVATGGGGTGGYGSPGVLGHAVVPEQPFTDAVGSRISKLLELLTDGREVLSSTGDRLLGAIPRGVSGDSAANKPNGVGAEIIVRLELAISTALDLLGEARRLQSGI